MEGFNISLTIGGKTLLGRTQDDLSISAKIKESLTKDDEGVTQKVITGHDITFSATALYSLNASGTTTQLDRDDLIALALTTGSSAVVAVVYGPEGGDSYSGSAIITGYSESSSASGDEDATISLDLAVIGTLTIVS